MSDPGGQGPQVAYVLTDYPRLAMTFIAGEIDGIERAGGRVVPIAMNEPEPDDLTTDDGRRRHARTLYLKADGARGLLGPLVRLAARHPLALARLIATAIGSSEAHGPTIGRRLVHVVYAARCVEHCTAEGVHHLHAHFGQSPATIAWFAAEIGNWSGDARWTWSVTVHGLDVDEVNLGAKVAAADLVVTVTHATRSEVMRRSATSDWPKVRVVRCGIDLDLFAFRPPSEREPAAGDATTILTVGRLAPEKGLPVLLDALAHLRDHHDLRPSLRLIGDGPSRADLEATVETLQLGDQVEFAGQQPPSVVAEELRSVDVFCLPSFVEGLPVAIMEAMAVGTPVVTTHVYGIPELAVDGVTATAVAPGDPVALSAALQTVLTDPDRTDRLARAARTAVEERHSDEPNVAELIRTLNEVIDGA